MGALSRNHITVGTTYTLEVDPDARSRPRERELFRRFKAKAPKSQLEIGEGYVNLLSSLVEHFVKNYK